MKTSCHGPKEPIKKSKYKKQRMISFIQQQDIMFLTLYNVVVFCMKKAETYAMFK